MTPDATRTPAQRIPGPEARLRQALWAAGLTTTTVDEADLDRPLIDIVSSADKAVMVPSWEGGASPRMLILPWDDACNVVEGFAQARSNRLGGEPQDATLDEARGLWRALADMARVLREMDVLAEAAS